LIAACRRAADCDQALIHATEIEIGRQDAGLAWELLPSSLETVRIDGLAPV